MLIRSGVSQVCRWPRGGTNSLCVAKRRFAKQPFVLTSEVGSILVSYAVSGGGGV